MTTTDHVFIVILSVLLSLFFILCIAAVLAVLKLMSIVKRVLAKAESVVDSVESATDVIKDVQGRAAIFKLVRNIYKLAQRRKK